MILNPVLRSAPIRPLQLRTAYPLQCLCAPAYATRSRSFHFTRRDASTPSEQTRHTVDTIQTGVKNPAEPSAPGSEARIATVTPPTPLELIDAINPPASTRPPPLDLPVRKPETSTFSHFLSLGKAYTNFYKAGIKAIFANRKLLASPTFTPPPGIPGADTTIHSRAAVLLRSRTRHDLVRIPIFGLLVLVCGEFTPLIVLVFPRVTPFTCRIPKQVLTMRRATETRRAASRRALGYVSSHSAINGEKSETAAIPAALERVSTGHVARSLGLTSSLWDRAGLVSPRAGPLVEKKLLEIVADDARICVNGKGEQGVASLVDEEVVLACEERGIDVLDKEIEYLRGRLTHWIRGTTAVTNPAEAVLRAKRMLLGLPAQG